MKPRTSLALFLLALFCSLLFALCADTVEESPGASPSVRPTRSPATEANGGQTVALTACFRREDGTVLSRQSIRLSDGEKSRDYPLDEEGRLQIAGLPKVGTYTVSVLAGGKEAGTMTLDLSTGSVIDAATDADGVGHVTIREDTDTVSLDFILDENGALTCSLRLSADDGQGGNEV